MPAASAVKARGSGAGPVPLIVDTGIFSDADDVGALATAFALQLKGEADVIAIGVNTRTSRPAVATESWRCAAAVAQFYGFGDVPIGSDMPDDGTSINSPDFVGPCSRLASPSTPPPDGAVAVFRRALAAQPDGSVVMVETSYEENLAALLDSPADSVSPLDGRDLVARKVRTLVIMGGGYPSQSGENNLIGNPAAAQDVAANWPTKIVWCGYRVGDAVHTGGTISAVHPADSPVRAAYGAFVGPGKWIYSYDLAAVYHAVRPGDPLLTEVGPGTNAIDGSGGNVFTPGSGNQYYLRLSDATALDASIEALLDTLPAPSVSASGPNDTFNTDTVDPAKWTVSPDGSTVAAANEELTITHPATSTWTEAAVESTRPFDETGRSVRLQLKRAADDGRRKGSAYGETSVYLRRDATHFVQFFVAGNALTAWYDDGEGGRVNLRPDWPAYSATGMQWLRFRESGGTMFWEYASGATAPGSWKVLAAIADPFPPDAVSLEIVAGSNVDSTDTMWLDNVATSRAEHASHSSRSPEYAGLPAAAPGERARGAAG